MNCYHQIFGLSFLFVLVCYLPTAGQDAVKNPVVKITALNEYGQEDDGSGVIVGNTDSELYIATAAHVIPLPDNITVTFYDGAAASAAVVQVNASLDIAVIKCALPAGYNNASFAMTKSEEKALQSVIVIGHPLGNNWDINFNTNVKATEYDLDERLFTLAPIGIGPGNSGGPVLNQQYELLGLVQNVDQVKAVCVEAAMLMKACRAWEVPANLLTGITLEETQAEAGEEDFRYTLFLQEANSAFAAGKWKEAKRAYTEAHALVPSDELKTKIDQCQLESRKDKAYASARRKGISAKDLQQALAFFEEARQMRDTEEIRGLIKNVREKLMKLDLLANDSGGGELAERFKDPLAGEFVLVKGGVFEMGDWDIAPPVHKVSLSDYYIGIHEVTNEQLCPFFVSPAFIKWEAENSLYRSHLKRNIKRTGASTYECTIEKTEYRKPSTHKSIQFMAAYCEWLTEKTGYTYRLPTEAEWEYAAMGGHKATPTKYAGSNDLDKVAWLSSELHDVMTKAPNELGIYDMTGNLIEYCSDLHDYYGNLGHPDKKENYSYYEECLNKGIVLNPKGPVFFDSPGSLFHNEPVARGGGKYRTYAPECHVKYRGNSFAWSERQSSTTPGGYRLVREAYPAGSSR